MCVCVCVVQIQPNATISDFMKQLRLQKAHDRPHIEATPTDDRTQEFAPPDQSHPRCSEHARPPEVPGDAYILIGLHTCGDLAPTMLRVYSQSDQIVGLVSVGCCYMKVTTSQPIADGRRPLCHSNEENIETPDPSPELTSKHTNNHRSELRSCSPAVLGASTPSEAADPWQTGHSLPIGQSSDLESASLAAPPTDSVPSKLVGYPLSRSVRSLPGHSLSYEAREVACHSIEAYRERLCGRCLCYIVWTSLVPRPPQT